MSAWTVRRGFTMLEIMVVLLLIGVAVGMVLPRMIRRAPDTEWPAITDELNNMLYFARQEAITTQKIHRLVFKKKEQTIHVEVQGPQTKPGIYSYESVFSYYFTTHYTFPEIIKCQAVKQGKKNLFDENKGVAYCYVVPHGLVEDVVVELERSDTDRTSSARFVIQPFLGSFSLVEEEGK